MAVQSRDPFEGVDWVDIQKRLLWVALKLSSLISTGQKVMAGCGFSAEDLVNETIAKALGGTEIRYQAEKGNLFGLLKQAMVRDFLDLRKKSSHKTTVLLDLAGVETQKDQRLIDHGASALGRSGELMSDMRRLVGDDSKMQEYLDAVDAGAGTPQEIADLCQTKVDDIYVRRRKMKKVAAGYLAGRASQ